MCTYNYIYIYIVISAVQMGWIKALNTRAEPHRVGHVPAAPNGAHDIGGQAVANVMIKTIQGGSFAAFPILTPRPEPPGC